jgi:hypothetical protein
MIKNRLVLPHLHQKDIDITLPFVPQIGSVFVINYENYKVESVYYEILPNDELGLVSVYLSKP